MPDFRGETQNIDEQSDGEKGIIGLNNSMLALRSKANKDFEEVEMNQASSIS